MTHSLPYKSATIAKSITGTVNFPKSPNHGKRVSLVLYHGYASHGWRTNYDRVPQAWLTISIEGQKQYRWAYSGKRFAKAEEMYNLTAADILPNA